MGFRGWRFRSPGCGVDVDPDPDRRRLTPTRPPDKRASPCPKSLLATCLLALATLAACAAPEVAAPCPSIPAAAPASVTASAVTPAKPTAPPEEASGYDKPPQNILDVIHAPSPPAVYVNPTHDTMLLVTWQEYPHRARRHAVPAPRGRARRAAGTTAARHARRLRHHAVRDRLRPRARRRRPRGARRASRRRMRRPARLDGRRQALRLREHHAPTRSSCGSATRPTGEVHRVRGRAAQPDARRHHAVDARPEDAPREARARRPGRAAAGARRRRSARASRRRDGEKGESSTYEARDTLTSTHDEDLFDYYAASQLALVDAATGDRHARSASRRITTTSTPRRMASTSSSTTIHKPYSYVTTVRALPARRRGVGSQPAQRRAHRRVAARSPTACRSMACRTGPRDFAWRATEPATLRLGRGARRRRLERRRSPRATR